MTIKEWLEGIEAELRRRFQLAGRGSISRVQKTLKLGAGYFRDQRRAGKGPINLEVLLGALDELGVDAGEFFAAVAGSADPVAEFRLEAAELRVKRGRKRLPRILGIESRRAGSGQAQNRKVNLEALDARRDSNPRWVMRRIKRLMPRVVEAQVAELLTIYASASRGVGALDEALLVLDRALELAEAFGELAVMGTAVRRCAALVADRGQYQRSLALAERAACCCATAGDPVGIAKSLLKTGMAYGCLERSDEEIDSFKAALVYLPASSDDPEIARYRFACLMNLGIGLRKQGDLDSAQRFALEARKWSEAVGDAPRGKLVWLQGSIAKGRGNRPQAEKYFKEALEIYRRFSPLTAALLTVELVKEQLIQGKRAEAYATAKATTTLLTPLEGNEIASAALLELLRCALSGRGLSIPVLDRIGRKLQKGRAQQRHRARPAGRES